jgi:hypothetical protein
MNNGTLKAVLQAKLVSWGNPAWVKGMIEGESNANLNEMIGSFVF